jgi:hypothetical protein
MIEPFQQTTRRLAIVEALVEKFKEINGTGNYVTDLADNIEPRMKFWDEINEYPALHVAAGKEIREYLPGGLKNRFLSVTVRGYVKEEDSVKAVEGLLADIEYVVEENGRLAYTDPRGVLQYTQDILIESIDTDEGALAPNGVGEILLQVRY